MIEAKSKVERWVTIPGALRIQKDRSQWSGENIFWANIPMHQREVCFGRCVEQCLQSLRPVGMRPRRRHEIRLQANRAEYVIACKIAPHALNARSGRVDSDEGFANGSCNIQIYQPFTQLAFPNRVSRRI